MRENTTLGEELVRRTLEEVIEGRANKAITKRILRRCLPSLRTVVNDHASTEIGKIALPACYGRHVIFATPHKGIIADMLRWADPIKELLSDDLGDRAAMWSAIASFVHKDDLSAALAGLATRLGQEGIADFEASLSRMDKVTGEVVFQGPDQETRLMARGALIVLAGVDSGASAGIIGALAVPVYQKPGPVADWHNAPDWSADTNHRRLH